MNDIVLIMQMAGDLAGDVRQLYRIIRCLVRCFGKRLVKSGISWPFCVLCFTGKAK